MRILALRLLLASSLATVVACRRPADDPSPPTDEGSAAAALDDGSAQGPVDVEEKPDEAPNRRDRPRRTLDDTLASVSDHAWLARIPSVDTAWDAGEIAGLLRRDDGTALVLTAERDGRTTTYQTWPVTRDVAAPTSQALAEFSIRAPDVAAARPLSVPGRGFGLLKPSDNVADATAPSTTLFWRTIGIDGSTLTDAIALSTGAWNVRREFTTAVVGEHVGICFDAFPAGGTPDGPLAIVCGAIDFDGAWVTPPTEVVPAGARPSGAVLGQGDGDDALLVIFEGDRLWGRLLTFGETLTVRGRTDLCGEAIAEDGRFEYRRVPLAMTAGDLTAYALPGHGEHHPRAGVVGADGQVVGGKRQIPELGTYTSRPVMMSTAVGPTMMYGEHGLDGERTAVVFREPRPDPVETVTPLGTLPPASQARQGAAADGLISLVFDIDDEDAAITALFEQSLIGSLRGVPEVTAPVPGQ